MAEVNPKPGKINETTGFREFTPDEHAAVVKKAAKTGINTHRATQRGYANGVLVETGDYVPDGIAVSKDWMERVDGKTDRLEDAVNEALDPLSKDVDLTKLSKPALEAMAAERGINVDGLGKDQLITAIKAAHDPKR
jgi:hypothetical protein